jgi:hypothetical protein
MYESHLYTEPKIVSFACLHIYNSKKKPEAHCFASSVTVCPTVFGDELDPLPTYFTNEA